MKWKVAIVLISTLLISTTSVAGEGDTYLSPEIQEVCFEVGEMYNISPFLLMAIIETESSGQLDSTNGSCKGLCQINSNVWKCEDYFDPCENIEMCAKILTHYSKQCSDIGCVLSHYNGISKADKMCEQGKISKYAQKVLDRAYIIEEFAEN